MTVEPMRDKTKIKQIYQYLYGKDPKYGLLFKFGLNSGLRISDILPLTIVPKALLFDILALIKIKKMSYILFFNFRKGGFIIREDMDNLLE